MDRVSTKITQKIRVLFEHQYFNSSTSQQKSQHHARRAAAHNAATGLQCFRRIIANEGNASPPQRVSGTHSASDQNSSTLGNIIFHSSTTLPRQGQKRSICIPDKQRPPSKWRSLASPCCCRRTQSPRAQDSKSRRC